MEHLYSGHHWGTEFCPGVALSICTKRMGQVAAGVGDCVGGSSFVVV